LDLNNYYTKKEDAIKQLILETDPKFFEEVAVDSSDDESEDENSEIEENNLNNNTDDPLISNSIIEDFKNEKENEIFIQEESKTSNLENTNTNTNNNNFNNNEKLNNQQREKYTQNIEMSNLNREDDIQITNINHNLENNNGKISNKSFLGNKNENPHIERINPYQEQEDKKNEKEREVKTRRKLSDEMNDIGPYLEKIEKKRKKKENLPEGPIR
jgi:hypothetical protein